MSQSVGIAPFQRRPISPAGWASVASGGRWVCKPHLALLNREIMELAIRREGGLLVSLPPRHGKSEFISRYLPGWWLGTFPDEQVLLGSYESMFAAEWGMKARNAFEEHAPGVFGLELDPDRSANAAWGVKGHEGGMRTAGIGGPFTGKGGHLLLADDLVKGAEEASSPLMRNKIWEWWQSAAYTRREPGAVVILMFTRWSEDDPVGRMERVIREEGLPGWKSVVIPALAEEDDILGRQVGEALWPERFSAEELGRIRGVLGSYWFSALYQQRPTPRGGGMLQRSWFENNIVTINQVPRDSEFVRFWDLSATDDGGDWTSGTLMARDRERRYYIVNIRRERMSPGKRDRMMKAVAEADRERWKNYRVKGYRDLGQAGISAGAEFVRNFEGFRVGTVPATGSKETNLEPFAAQAEGGNVFMVEGEWNEAFLKEAESFPNGTFDDQCLIAGTVISTDRGGLPIEHVRPGMRVLTRRGYRRVMAAGVTGHDRPVVQVEFSDGTVLTGTGNHPVWTPNASWEPLDTCSGALSAVPISRSRIVLAPLSVARVHAGFVADTVFNLSVEGEHEYFANGVLAHNCDSTGGAFNELAGNAKKESNYQAGGKPAGERASRGYAAAAAQAIGSKIHQVIGW